jgi:hypothetical protein
MGHNIFQITFIRRDGSLIVSFPYGAHSQGLLSIGTLPEGQLSAQVSLEPEGRCTSHKVKYTHHPDGEAHFSQDGKILTTVRRQSVPLVGTAGHIFTVQAASLHEFQRATRPKDLAQPTASRANLTVDCGPNLPQAIKFVGRLYRASALEARLVGSAPSVIGPILPLRDSTTASQGFCIGNPSAALADMVLLITCHIIPSQNDWSGLIFYGGFDPQERFDDISRSASFLALSYPIEDFDTVATRTGSVDRPLKGA